jgi:hypothetical protein
MVMVLLLLKLQAQLNVVGLRLRRLLRGWEIDESRINECVLEGCGHVFGYCRPRRVRTTI